MSIKPDISKVKSIYEKVFSYSRLAEDTGLDINTLTDFHKLPIMEKKKLIESQSANIMPEYYKEYIADNLIKARTSGSTGQYLEIYWDKVSYIKSMIELWMLRAKHYEIYPHNRLAFFFTEYENEEYYVQRKNEFGICKKLLNENSMEEVYRLIIEWDPEWMILQPSTAVILCEYIKYKKLNKPESLRYIEFTGEILTDEVDKMAQEVLGCKTANQYGCNEVNSIALQCPEGNMHILNSNVYVEIVDDDVKVLNDSLDASKDNDSEGRIILTSLQNKTMPFIRYDIGDRGRILSNNNCSCGCNGKVLNLSSGRNNDYVIFADGTRTSSYIFVRIFDMVNLRTDSGILQFYVEQVAYDEFNVIICKDEELSDEYIISTFYKCLDDIRLKDCKYNFEFSERLFEVRGSGKHMYFRNKMS